MTKKLKDFEEILQNYIDDFENLQAREQLQTILELGQDLENFPQKFKINENKVKGCISDAYIFVDYNKENDEIIIYGTSDALIIKGYMALLIDAISGLSLLDIQKIDTKLDEFAQKTNIKATLSQSRASTFGNIIAMIKEQAHKYQEKDK